MVRSGCTRALALGPLSLLLLACMRPAPRPTDPEARNPKGSEPEEASTGPILPDDYSGKSATLRGPIWLVDGEQAPRRKKPFKISVGCHVVRVRGKIGADTSSISVDMVMAAPPYFVIHARPGYRYVVKMKILKASVQGRLSIQGTEIAPDGSQRALRWTDDPSRAKC